MAKAVLKYDPDNDNAPAGPVYLNELAQEVIDAMPKVKVNSSDSTAEYADDKIQVAGSISKSTYDVDGVKKLLLTGLNGLGWQTVGLTALNEYNEKITNVYFVETMPDDCIKIKELNLTSEAAPATGSLKNIIILMIAKESGTCIGDLAHLGSLFSSLRPENRPDMLNRMVLLYAYNPNEWFNIQDGGTTPNDPDRTRPVLVTAQVEKVSGLKMCLLVYNQETENGWQCLSYEYLKTWTKRVVLTGTPIIGYTGNVDLPYNDTAIELPFDGWYKFQMNCNVVCDFQNVPPANWFFDSVQFTITDADGSFICEKTPSGVVGISAEAFMVNIAGEYHVKHISIERLVRVQTTDGHRRINVSWIFPGTANATPQITNAEYSFIFHNEEAGF